MTRLERLGLWGARLLLGALFVYAGATKALDPQRFAGQIAGYDLFAPGFGLVVAATLPYVELLAGALLVAGWKVRPAVLIILVLTLLFLGLLGWAWLQGLQIDCGCFQGPATSPRSAWLRDLVILGLALWLWLRYEGDPVVP